MTLGLDTYSQYANGCHVFKGCLIDSWPLYFFTIYKWMSWLQRMSHCNVSFDLILLLLNSCLKLYLNLLLLACKIYPVKIIPKQNKMPFNLPLPAKQM